MLKEARLRPGFFMGDLNSIALLFVQRKFKKTGL
jgi:hypothetical protein